MLTSRLVVGKALYALACVAAAVTLVVAGYVHRELGLVDATQKGIHLNGAATVTASAMNILIMGLESRTNYYGQTLPQSQLLETHSGNEQSVADGEVGAQDTDTLILVHIFQGGQKATGFSIPRDDLVTYPHATYLGITQGKVDQAYDLAYNPSLGQPYGSSMSQKQRYLEANQAGQAFEIATVEAVTGVHIDHFVEANLIGFYNLAGAFGGIEVCIKPAPAQGGLPAGANLTDYDVLTGTDNSGFSAYRDGYNRKKGGAQYLHLSPAQSLAYVRSRDTLPGIDIGRTKRQQAVIDYVVWKLKNNGAFSDFHLAFQTLPFASQVNEMPLNGSKQDVNLIDLSYIQQYVKSAFSAPPSAEKKSTSVKKTTNPAPAPSTVTVDVYNGSGVNGLAGNVSQALTALGYKAGTVANASTQSQTLQQGTQVFYGAGASANATKIATQFGATATALTSLPANQVEVLLGSAVTVVPAGLASSQGSGAGGATSSPSATAAGNNGTTGGTLTVTDNAKYGVPCVY